MKDFDEEFERFSKRDKALQLAIRKSREWDAVVNIATVALGLSCVVKVWETQSVRGAIIGTAAIIIVRVAMRVWFAVYRVAPMMKAIDAEFPSPGGDHE